MNVVKLIEGLSNQQKLQIMEAIWDDLCNGIESPCPPMWHEQVLTDRQSRIDRGESTFVEWNELK